MQKILFAVIVLAAGVSGCTKDHAARVDTSCINCVDTVSFKQNIIPILHANCAISGGCHDPNDGSGGLVLDSTVAYNQIFAQGSSYLEPGNSASSLFYIEISPASTLPMPPDKPLDVCDIHRIKCWIDQGALNN